MDAIGEAMDPPFSSEDVDVSSSECCAADSCSDDRVLTTLAATSEDIAALEMAGMFELLDAAIGPVPVINRPCSSGFLPSFWLLLLLSHGSTSDDEFGLLDEGSDATDGLKPPPAPAPTTFEPFVRCLMFSRLLMLNVSSSDWLDTHESFASTDPPYRKSPICSESLFLKLPPSLFTESPYNA